MNACIYDVSYASSYIIEAYAKAHPTVEESSTMMMGTAHLHVCGAVQLTSGKNSPFMTFCAPYTMLRTCVHAHRHAIMAMLIRTASCDDRYNGWRDDR